MKKNIMAEVKHMSTTGPYVFVWVGGGITFCVLLAIEFLSHDVINYQKKKFEGGVLV